MVDDINKKGGLLGKKVEAVVVDPASNWPLFRREGARPTWPREKVARGVRLLTRYRAKSVLPVFEEAERAVVLSGGSYEGEESSRNVFYTRGGAEPAGDSGGRIPDGRGRRRCQALGARRHRLRLSAQPPTRSSRPF